eukprot:8614947-Pyramimonas_sp.AAC.1
MSGNAVPSVVVVQIGLQLRLVLLAEGSRSLLPLLAVFACRDARTVADGIWLQHVGPQRRSPR